MKNRITTLSLFGALVIVATPAFSDDQNKILTEIINFAERVCQTTPIRSKSDELQLSGKANADLKGLVSKVVNLGVVGAAQYKKTESEGVLQKDLAGLLSKETDCKAKVSDKLIDKLIPNIAPAKTGGTLASALHNTHVLSPVQERLLELLAKYQRQFAITKLVVHREQGTLIFDDGRQNGRDISLVRELYGSNKAMDVVRFEDLMESIPPEYLRAFPETRYDSPFIVRVTEEGMQYLRLQAR